jgi:hypothetical protein
VSEERPVPQKYDINLDDKFGQLSLIDVAAEAAAHEPWFNQTLTSVNDAVVRLGVLEGETVRLGPQHGFTVPKGVMHKTSAPRRTVVVMVEPAGVAPTGDS